jgi:tetratricopeptide (TPR) repeat protein
MLADAVRPNELVVQRLKRDIEKLRTVSPIEYYMLLGMLYSVLGNEKECRENHDRTLRMSNDEVVLLNYGHSLRRLGHPGEAIPHMMKAFEQSPTEDIFSEVAQAMFYSGDLSEYHKLLERFIKCNPNRPIDSVFSARYIKNLKSCLERAGVSLRDFHTGMRLLEKVLLDNEAHRCLEAIKFTLSNFEGVSHLTIRVLLKELSVESIVRVNEAIADELVDAEDMEAWDRLIISAAEFTEVDRAAAVA